MNENVDEALAASLYQMEIDRIKYLLASYLRTRLFKVEHYARHVMSDPELQSRLSKQVGNRVARGRIQTWSALLSSPQYITLNPSPILPSILTPPR